METATGRRRAPDAPSARAPAGLEHGDDGCHEGVGSERGNDDRAFAWTFLGCAGLVLLPLWTVRYPPMVDLPQHAAQIELWRTFDELDPAIRSTLEIRPLTPYLGCYLLGRLLFLFFSPLVAMKVVVSLAFLALPAATLLLLRFFDRSRWWALATFPLAYSVSATWGLLALASLDLSARALGFDAEAHGLDVVMESMEPGQRVLGLVFDRSVPSLPRGSHLVQQVAWVQVEKGGWVDFSVAFLYVQLVHVKEPARAGYTYLLQWKPEAFDPRQWGDYDLFVVHRVGPDPGPTLFQNAAFPWRRVDRAGSWWVYERLDRKSSRAPPTAPTE